MHCSVNGLAAESVPCSPVRENSGKQRRAKGCFFAGEGVMLKRLRAAKNGGAGGAQSRGVGAAALRLVSFDPSATSLR